MKFMVDSGDVDESLPLIYLWEIFNTKNERCYCYVGKAKGGAKRPLSHYTRNVANLLAGQPYRKNRPNSYRLVHQRLAEAERQGLPIKLSFICNVGEDEDINAVERKWQRHHECS